MQLFYAAEITPPIHTLTEEESRHCVRVLRLGAGDPVTLTDGRGTLYHGRIADERGRCCTISIERIEERFEPLPYRLTMAVAPTKNADRYEWFLEKATEVGVSRIVPLLTDHSERRIFKPERSEKVITAAMKQSLKAYRPQLDPLTPFAALVAEATAGRRFIAHCEAPHGPAGKPFLASVLRPGEEATILIGPEGDFSTAEIDAALAAGFEEISLGTQRLRTETAAVAATVMVATLNQL